MTDVKLQKFNFALPIKVEQENMDSSELKSNCEFPHEFFGLDSKLQVAVANGVLSVALMHVAEIKKNNNIEITNDVNAKLNASTFPLNLGVGVQLQNSERQQLSVNFSFPDTWTLLCTEERKYILQSIAYLFQITCMSIVNRNLKHKESL